MATVTIPLEALQHPFWAELLAQVRNGQGSPVLLQWPTQNNIGGDVVACSHVQTVATAPPATVTAFSNNNVEANTTTPPRAHVLAGENTMDIFGKPEPETKKRVKSVWE